MRTRFAVTFLGFLVATTVMAIVITTSSEAATLYDGTFCAPSDVRCAPFVPGGSSGACQDQSTCGGNCRSCNGSFDPAIRYCCAYVDTTKPTTRCAIVPGRTMPCGNITGGTCESIGAGLCRCSGGGAVVAPCEFQECDGTANIP
jgi:hypothetical protein